MKQFLIFSWIISIITNLLGFALMLGHGLIKEKRVFTVTGIFLATLWK